MRISQCAVLSANLPGLPGSQTLTPEGCKKLVLTRGYICRRQLSGIPFAFDYLAHSAQLFDAHTLDQVEEMQKDPKITLNPVTRFLFERLADRDDPETGLRQPYFGMKLETTCIFLTKECN
jgi:hypothetical protein